jgi:hypothetical protein
MPDDETDYVGDALAESRARHPVASSPPPQVPREPGTSPTFLIVTGVVVMALGMVVTLGGSVLAVVGAIIGMFGAVIAAIGVVAAGVRLGAEWTDYDRRRRERP